MKAYSFSLWERRGDSGRYAISPCVFLSGLLDEGWMGLGGDPVVASGFPDTLTPPGAQRPITDNF